jgi:nucleotide-binding universal stress UspA family protein
MKRVVVGYDGSEEASRALTQAADVAEAFSARLVVVSVTSSASATAPALAPPVPEPIGHPGVAPILDPGELTRVEAPEPAGFSAAGELSERQLELARSTLLGRAVDAEYVAEIGELAERVLEAAKRVDADLIVVGAHERGFLAHLLGRSLDEKVVRGAERDVLVVR